MPWETVKEGFWKEMKPIPAGAMPVVEILRRDVPRPEHLPRSHDGITPLRWDDGSSPMGLHPKSTSPRPVSQDSFAKGECDILAMAAFIMWWDCLEQRYARPARDAIWPLLEE